MLRFFSTIQTLSSHLIRARSLMVAFGGVLLLSTMAHASLIPSLVSGPVNQFNGTYRYNYQVSLSADERLDVMQTNGITCPGPSNSNVQCNPAGTFVTIYDVPGLIGLGYTPDSSTPPGGFFNGSIQPLGPTPNSINGAAFDSPSVNNAVFTYSGPNYNGPATFTGFYIITSYSGLNPVGNFTSQSTNNTTSSTNGTSDQVIGSVPIPVGPSAATATVSGKITTPLGRGVRDVKVTITGTTSGETKTVLSGQFGYYNFPDMQVGETYIITAVGKHYTFTQSTQLKLVLTDTPDVDFYAIGVGK